MKKTVFFAILLSVIAAGHAQDTVHFTDTRQDTTYYFPYGYNNYATWGANEIDSIVCIFNIWCEFSHDGITGEIMRNVIRQHCDQPLTIYGVAASFRTPDTALWGINTTPYEHFCAWIVERDSGANGVTFHATDSVRAPYSTRYLHLSLPTKYAPPDNCDSITFEPRDTIVPCHEFYFEKPIVVNSDFYLGVYMDTIISSPHALRPLWIEINQIRHCQRPFALYDDNTLAFSTSRANAVDNPWLEWFFNDQYPLVMAITVPPVEDTVPGCGSVDSLWTSVDDSGGVSLSWNAASCAYRYEVNYGSDKTFMDTTVITSSTTLQLTGLTPGSLAYARVRTICRHDCPFHDTIYYSPWTDSLIFLVPTDTTPCPDVHGLTASWMDANCAYVTWTPVDDLSTYQLNYAEADSLFENGTFVSCPHPYAPVCGLSTNKAYKMRVRTPCSTGMASEGYGPWSDTLLFNPQPTGIGATDAVAFTLRPNPTRDRLTVERPTAGPATLEVFNAKGQKVMTMASDQATVTLDVSSLAAGSYLLRVTTAEGSSVRSFVVGR